MTNAKTILLVDDDSEVRGGLQTVLEENGYRTLEADDGSEAKDLIHKYQPDLVILDMMMPRWGGFAVLEHFQDNPAAPQFLMLTGHDGEKHKAYAKKIGVADYLIKPCPMDRLLKRVNQLCHPGGSKTAPARPSAQERAARVLLIDVHKPLLRALNHGLEDVGLAVESIASGSGNLKASAADHDIMVLDWMVAPEDGPRLLQEWRAVGLAAEILVLTAKDCVQDRVKGLDLGADDCLARPFHLSELIARVRALVRRRRRQTPDPLLRVEDLEIDATMRAVKRGGQYIALTPREFDLLLLLARNEGTVVTRTTILNHLYPDRGDNHSNVVDVYIRYLRAKIDTGFRPKLITTRWGEGYLLGRDAKAPSAS
jgi:DNA-binding response OmpR family regulator